QINPDDYQSLSLQSMAYQRLGRTADALASQRQSLQRVEKHLELHPEDTRALYLGANAFAGLGAREKSLEWTHRALALEPEDSGVLYNVGCNYALLGEPEKALQCLEKAVGLGFGHKEWLANDSDLDSLRTHPRFQALLEKLTHPGEA
ncbi:MAG: tetratricopeptide repeat protein, partial [Terriglobales bacterium]